MAWCTSQKAGETCELKYGSVIRSDVDWDDQGGADVTCVSCVGLDAVACMIGVE